jgi:hypothetical protein
MSWPRPGFNGSSAGVRPDYHAIADLEAIREERDKPI